MTILPDIGNEHCDVTDGYPPPAYWPAGSAPGLQILGHATEIYKRTAQTVWHVQTGGKAKPGRQNLWQFTGSAAQLLNLRAQPPFTYASTQPIPPTQVALGGLGNLQADGTLWVTLPDGIEEDVTPSVPGLNFYNFSVGGGKYHCYFTAYAEEPNPGGGRHSIVSLSKFNAGHGWWCLSSDAPVAGLHEAGISSASLSFLGDQVGYFPLVSLTSLFDAEPGILENPGSAGRIDAQRTFEVGFNGLEGGLDYTANLSSNPGEYSLYLYPNNCVTTTIQAAAAAGVTLPPDTTPQNLGIDLNAMPNQ